jgi:hypothetical protein
LKGSLDGNTEITSSETVTLLSTGKDQRQVGEDADIVFGFTSYVMVSETRTLTYSEGCAVPIVADAFSASLTASTAFGVSVFHVKRHILPVLDSLEHQAARLVNERVTRTLSDEENNMATMQPVFSEGIKIWNEFLTRNQRDRMMGGIPHKDKEIRNIAFSGGNVLDYSEYRLL